MTLSAVPVHVLGVDVKTTTAWRVEGPTEEKRTELVHMVPDGANEFTFTLPAMRFVELQWTLLRVMVGGHTGTPIGKNWSLPRVAGESLTVILANFHWPTKYRVKAPTEEMVELLAGGLTQIEETWRDEVGSEFAAVVPPFDPTKVRVEMRSAVEPVDVSSLGGFRHRVPGFREEEITVRYQDNGVQLVGQYRVSPLMLEGNRLPIEEILRLLTMDLKKKWNERFGLTKDEVLAARVLDKGALAKSIIVPNGADINLAWTREELMGLKKIEQNPTAAEMNRKMKSMQSKTELTIEAIREMQGAAAMSDTEIRKLIGTLDDAEKLKLIGSLD